MVLDHLAAHKVTGVRPLCRAIAAAGASILYLPPYSPDLAAGSQYRPRWSVRSGAPIEQLSAKLKALLRKTAARTKDALWQAIGRRLAAVLPSECTHYLDHCGYGAT